MAGKADQLLSAYQHVLANPTDSDVNLQYALIAEGQKKWRLALAAYERILSNDPNNVAAKNGLQRIRRIIQPPSTQTTVELGTEWDSNQQQEPGGTDDFTFYAKGRVRDERNWFGQRWRTTATAYADTHAFDETTNYAVALFDVGPILDLKGTFLAARPFVGGGVASLRGHYYYSEVNVGAGIEGYLNGAFQSARIRGGYRGAGDAAIGNGAGFYAEASAHWTHQNIFSDHDVFWIEPWVRWSGIDGNGFDFFNGNYTAVTPGHYLAGGGRFEFDNQINSWLTVGASVSVSERDYDVGGRRDFLLAPGASLVFSNIFSPQTDIRVDYEFQHNDSNQAAHDYDNHAVTVALVARR